MLKKRTLFYLILIILFVPIALAQDFIRGDANSDGAVNIADSSFIFNFLFAGGSSPQCEDSADANDDGRIDITDGAFINNFLFLGGPSPPSPFPSQGNDPTRDKLTCGAEGEGVGGDFYVRIDSTTPTGVCTNLGERTDITVVGRLPLTANGRVACLFPGGSSFSITIRVMEDDPLFNDLIVERTLFIQKECSDTSDFYLFFTHTFEDIDLSSQFTIVKGTIEVFAEAESNDNLAIGLTGENYLINREECDCLSGPCCVLGSRPFTFRSSGSQPTGFVDGNICTGIESPTTQQTITQTNYFCNGLDAQSHSTTSNIATCGICQFCRDGDSQCRLYNSRELCGTTDCDTRDTECRNYMDVNSVCITGSCTQQSCTQYIDSARGTQCNGGAGRCDGSGSCVNCQDRGAVICFNNDEYWARVCGAVIERQELKQDCGEDSCQSLWFPYCDGNDLRERRTCTGRGCANNACFATNYQETRFVQTCQFGCERNSCNPNPNIECSGPADCPATFSAPFCSAGNVRRTQTNYECQNPGTISSSCVVTSTRESTIEQCSCGCSNAQCISPCPPDCQNECTSGQTRCLSSTTQQTCGNHDKDSCTEWGGNLVCPAGCSNNQCTQPPPLPRPDVTINNLVVQWPRDGIFTLNNQGTIAFEIANIGEANTNNIFWRINYGDLFTDQNTNAISLTAGSSTVVFVQHAYRARGTFTITATLDPSNTIAESNENNNQRTLTVQVL